MNDLVSIITPTYNCGRFIADTIRSVLAQTYSHWEMIIVDDCSTDDTTAVVSEFSDDRIQYHRLSQNSGAAVARTVAMEKASGTYMAFLDSDDLWMPDKLEKQLKFMSSHGYAFTCTAYDHIAENGAPIGKIIHTKPKTNYNGLLLTCPVGNSTVMYNVNRMGKFVVPDIRKRNDDALWLQMLKVEKYIYGMDDILMHYRLRTGSISRNKFELIAYHWQLYRKIEKLSVPRSAFHIGFWCLIKMLRIK